MTAEQRDNLVLGSVDFEDVVVSAARRWSHSAGRTWGIDVRAEGLLVADRDRIDAALDAVIENAVQATAPTDRIMIVGRADLAGAIIEVSDSGVGIEPGDFRASSSASRASVTPTRKRNGYGAGAADRQGDSRGPRRYGPGAQHAGRRDDTAAALPALRARRGRVWARAGNGHDDRSVTQTLSAVIYPSFVSHDEK